MKLWSRMYRSRCISLVVSVGCVFLGAGVVHGQVLETGDCGLSIGPEALKNKVVETFDGLGVPLLFFTDKQIIFVQKSLDSYCCRTQKLGTSSCENKSLFPEDKNVINSPYYLDHFLSLYNLYLRGDNEVCSTYDFDCHARIENEKGYPGKPVCFRYGEEADPRCKSLYDVGSGVDTLGIDTATSSPGDYRSLYEKFRSDNSKTVIPSADTLQKMDPKEYTLVQMGYHMCNEASLIYKHILETDTSSDQSMNPIPGTTLQKCHTSVMQSYRSHAVDYIRTMSLAEGAQQMKKINEDNRNHLSDILDDLRKTMSGVRSKMTNMLRKFPEFTNTCSV